MTQPNLPLEPKFELKHRKHAIEIMKDPRSARWVYFMHHMFVNSQVKNTAGNKFNIMVALFEMCYLGIDQTPRNILDYVNSMDENLAKTSNRNVYQRLMDWTNCGCVIRYDVLRKGGKGRQSVYLPDLDGMEKYYFGEDTTKRQKVFL